jgi:hypothetical protein
MAEKKRWEKDPTERGLREANELVELIKTEQYCRESCRRRGEGALCAFELAERWPTSLGLRLNTVAACQDALRRGIAKPNHGLRK